MSKPGLIYRMQWDTTSIEGQYVPDGSIAAVQLAVNIYDMENLIEDDEDEEIITLTPAMPPVTLSTINNDEDKFLPIRAKQLTIRFLSETARNLDITTFADASDNRWKVVFTSPLETLFIGFLMLADMQQLFLPDPQVVELTASDHLGVLKDIPLVDEDGLNPQGKYRIASLLAMALKKTGLELELYVVNNIRHGSGVLNPTLINFDDSPNSIQIPITDFFYVGQEITISGSVSNDGTYHVNEVAQTIVTLVGLDEAVTAEIGTAGVTITDTSTGGHFYDKIYLDAKTFETTIGASEDCYTVLEKILGEDCFLTQSNGRWAIIRLDEFDENPIYPYIFDANGDNPVLQSSPNLNRAVGQGEEVFHADASTIIRLDRPHKFVREIFRYESPEEIVCNKDFARGDVITPPDLSAASSTGDYEIDCWTLRRISGSITSTAFVRKEYIYGAETNRYVIITPKSTTATPYDFIESQAIETSAGDKASVGVSYRYENDYGGGGNTVYFMRIYIFGADGNWWYWWDNGTGNYQWTNAGASEVERLIGVTWDASAVDESEWRSLSVDLDPMPVSGKLYIGLNQGHQVVTGGTNQNVHYQGLTFDYKPVINGTYELYTGHHNKVTRGTSPDSYAAIREKQVYIGDSPRPEFKGAMFFLAGAEYKLTTRFYAANVFALGSPSAGATHPYGYLQAFSVWNQYVNSNRVFPSALYGLFSTLASGNDFPDLINKFLLTDTNVNTNNRFFILISFDIDMKELKWRATFVECFRRDLGHVYTDDHEFKYLTGNE